MPTVDHPLREVLDRVGPDSCPGQLNFHCHTVCSDGSLEPEALIEQATRLGLQHLAVTDHHSSRAHPPMQAWLRQRREAGEQVPTLWSGMEISCLLRGCLVHVLALGFELDHPALQPYNRGDAVVGEPLRAEAVVKAIHAAGGLAVLAHPARYRLGHAELIDTAASIGMDGGEAWYDYDMQPRWQPSPLVCEAIDRQLSNLGLLRTCGTDSHGIDLSGR
ncbi:phosphoesterase [Synechococcus sp. KORDI-100]|uniref:PHP domain-containing protein n=1 Tax=Synechococcus sp. KORDI-100 TaxID=1280380 RepID=UPI0004E043A5|nr:PHP domain-containing protein [Synechococcus sp. KORDI-100]AII43445.1 phosphoesterase [Synechococcus sp. KORDI-100]